MGSVFDSLLLGSKQQNFQLAHCPCHSLWAINIPQDPLNSNVEEEVIERDEEEEEVIEEYDRNRKRR